MFPKIIQRKIASTDPEYYARRFRKDTDHYESDKLKRYKDKEKRKTKVLQQLDNGSRKTKTQLEGNGRGAHEFPMKDFKRFMEEKVGTRKANGERTGYSRGLGHMSTRSLQKNNKFDENTVLKLSNHQIVLHNDRICFVTRYQDVHRQPKVDVATPVVPMDLGKQVQENLNHDSREKRLKFFKIIIFKIFARKRFQF